MSIKFNHQSSGTKHQPTHVGFKSFESKLSDSLYFNLNNGNYHQHQYSTKYPLINHVGIYIDTNSSINVDNIGITEDIHKSIPNQSSANFPLFFNHKNKIKIPSKIEFALRRYTPRGLLRDIHPDIDVAIELCLLFASQLSSTYFDVRSGNNPDGWKTLNSRYLRDLLSTDALTYKKVRIALEYPLKKGPILICDYLSIEGQKSYNHRLGDAYILKGIKTYKLKTQTAIGLLNKKFMRSYGLALTNPICKNLIDLYPSITLPTNQQVIAEAKRLIKIGYKTPKGKKLAFLNKHSRSYFKNPESISFVEDALNIYEYLTGNGLMIPIEGSAESGGRVVDSFTLMPSWIRRLVKINGKEYVEADYSCLHPNIAMSLYGGTKKYLTHADVANATGLDLNEVKIEHLSFFNKKIWQIKHSPLYQYYQEQEPQMMDKLIHEKQASLRKHRVTSMRMFEIEVNVMKEVIMQLNKENINVGYVYDALFCHPKHAERVKQVMDSTIICHGIKTVSKIAYANHNDTTNVTPNLELNKPSVSTELPIISINQIIYNTSIKEHLLSKIKNGEVISFTEVLVDFGDSSECLPTLVTSVEHDFPSDKCYMTKKYLIN